MDSSRGPRTTDILTKLPGFASLFALASGAVVVLGWSLGIAEVTRMLPGFAPAPLLAGAAMLLSGAALWLVRDAEAGTFRRVVSAGLAVLVAAIAVTAIGERATNTSVDWATLGQRVASVPGLTQQLPVNSAWGYLLVAVWTGTRVGAGSVLLYLLAYGVTTFTPLPARITLWSVALALAIGIGAGVVFGVYPASRASRLDPITALRVE